jgi:hypothetical protein
LRGFLVFGITLRIVELNNIVEKSRQKTAKENPFPSKLWGGVFGRVAERERDIYYISLYGIIKLTCPIAPGPILYGL